MDCWAGNPEMGSRKSGNDSARHKDTGTFAETVMGGWGRDQIKAKPELKTL